MKSGLFVVIGLSLVGVLCIFRREWGALLACSILIAKELDFNESKELKK